MKKVIALFLAFASITFAGCRADTAPASSSNTSKTNNDEGMVSATDSLYENDQIRATKKALAKSSIKPIDKLITKKYPQGEIINKLVFFGSDNYNTMLDQLEEWYPVECLRTFDQSLPYCVYKLKEGGLLFVFFRGDVLKFTNSIFIVKQPLSKSDFDSIQTGSSLKDVEKIDSGTKCINSIKTDYLVRLQTYHMVKEGFIKIKYTTEDYKPETYKVESVEFVPNGGELNEYTYTFLQQDYPE